MGSSFPPLPKKLEEGCCGPDRPPEVSVDRHHLRATVQLTGLPTVGMAGNAGVGCSGPRLPFMSLTPGSGWADPGLGTPTRLSQSDALACTFQTHSGGPAAWVAGAESR